MLKLLKSTYKKSILIFSVFFSYVFSIFVIIGNQLKKTGMTECGVKGKGKILLLALLLVPVVEIVVYLIVVITDKNKEKAFECKKTKTTRFFLISFVTIFLAYVPVFLAYYPAIMAYDFHRQSQEAMKGFAFFWPYQPIVHTWLYWLFFKIGIHLGSLEIGMAFYSLFQMLIMSLVLAYATEMIYRITKKIWAYTLSLACFSFFPFFSVMVVEATKDVIFSATFVLFLLIFIEKELFVHENKWKLNLAWILVGTVVTQFRKNAIYALIVFAVIYFISLPQKEKAKNGLLLICLIVSCQITSMLMPKLIGTEMKEPQIEKYNVVIQPFARVLYYHSEEMDPILLSEIEEFVPEDKWIQYNPAISDPVKWGLGDWDGDISRLIKLWAKTGCQYPNEYLDAILLTNAGYLFFDDVSWCEVLGVGLEGRMGAIYTYNSTVSDVIPEGIKHESKLPIVETFLEQIVSANSFYNIPILNIIFRPALYAWISVFALCVFAVTKQRKKAAIALFPALYLGTLLFGPMVCWRYIYPVALFVPVLISVWFAGNVVTRTE